MQVVSVDAPANVVSEFTSRRDLARQLKDLGPTGRTEAYNVGYLVLTWTVIAAAFALAWRARRPWALAAAAAVITSRQQALLNVEHDAMHGSLFRNRRLNDAVGIVASGAPCGSGLRSTRAQHLMHHRLVNTPDDPDGYLHHGDHLATSKGLARHLAEGFSGVYAVKILRLRTSWVSDEVRRRDRRELVAVQLGLWGVSAAATSWWLYPSLWLAPLLTVTSGCVVVRNYVDHAVVGDEEGTNPERRVSVVPNPAEGAMVSPFAMHYHAEHHLFPWLPAQNLGEAHRRLNGLDGAPRRLVHRSYLGTLLRHLRTLPRL